MKTILKYALLLLCFLTIETAAQTQKSKPPTFVFKPTSMVDIPDTVRIFFRKGSVVSNQAGERMKISPSPDGSFSFSPSFIQPVYWVQVYFEYHKKRQRAEATIFYAEPNDQVTVTYTKHPTTVIGSIPSMDFKYSGIGITKYKVVEQLKEIKKDLAKQLSDDMRKEFGADLKSKDEKTESDTYYQSKDLQNYLNSVLENVKTANKREEDTLLKYKSGISSNLLSYFNYELSNSYYFPFRMDYLFRNSKSEKFRKTITDFYFANKHKVIVEVNDKLLKYSNDYKFNKLLEIKYETTLKGNVGDVYRAQYDAVKSIANPELRDILITYFFTESVFTNRIANNESQDSCLRDALKFIKLPELIEPIKRELLFFQGSKVPDFSFSDLGGKYTSLSDLKGKTFIMDFYFYGCKGCIAFAKRFKTEVYPEFENNPSFKVISVSIDPKREHWIAAMESGLYNEKSYINLSAGKLEWKHPFLTHYKQTSFPFILLVGPNGKLIAKIKDHSSMVIGSLIRGSLNEKGK